MRKHRDYIKVERVIESCVTFEQAKVAERMAYNYSKTYGINLDLEITAMNKTYELRTNTPPKRK